MTTVTTSSAATADAGPATPTKPAKTPKGSGSPFRRGLRRFLHNKLAVFGLIVLGFFLVFCFIGPLVYPTDQVHTDLASTMLPPGTDGHPLGTDDVGYDVLGRLMIAGQISIVIGLAAGVLATVIGTLWGAVAGYVGGAVDAVMMRIVDAGIAIPATFLLLILSAIMKPSVPLMIVVIGLVSWLVPARLVRAESISLKSREYVLALRAMGGTHGRAVMKHIVPNTVGTIVVNATFQVADAILLVAYVSFLGMGLQKPATDWGAMLTGGMQYTYAGAWWLIFPAGLCIVLVVVAFNAIGDGLRDFFDVKGRDR
ncbi:ABC transporter permease [Microbacterium jejuense]|uniref:ABC transporter permease n=1 Tax=Microbacterium jejuense TaxID=1263637 RepID=A0ABS7HMQ4_9MICO|nr:ABC transporter permease [Microbacterium jejuense]MBW9094246.1 ABC transporter permease [Microbacterium jejuense]